MNSTDVDDAFESHQGGRRVWYYLPRGTRFYTQNSKQDWVYCEEATARRIMVMEGMSDCVTKADLTAGERLSQVDKEIIDIKLERIVRYAGAVAGWKRGLLQMNGKPVLVTEEQSVVKPKPPPEDAPARPDGSCRGWPSLGAQFERWLSSVGWYVWRDDGEAIKTQLGWLRRFEDGQVPKGARPEDDGYDQRPYFFAHLARWYDALLSGRPQQGQSIVFAGDTGCGKTLCVQILERIFGGESAQPYAWLMGGQFNKDLVSATVLTIDDEVSKSDMKSRKDLGARLKQFVAVPKIRIEGKGDDAVILTTCNRVIFCVNLTEDNLSVLPPPSEDLVDADGQSGKIMLMKFYSHGWCGPFRTESEKRALFEGWEKELPYFLHWLLNEFELEEQFYDERFGVIPWMHPEILESLEALSPWQRTLYYIDRVCWLNGYERRVVTSEMVLEILTADDNGIPVHEKQTFKKNYLHLGEIAKKRPDRVVDLRSAVGGKMRPYAIFKEGARKDDEAERKWIKESLECLMESKKGK